MPIPNDIERFETAGLGLVDSVRSRFAPVRDELFRASNQQDLTDDLAEGRDNVNDTFQSLSGSLSRNQRALGLNVSDRQQAAQKRRLGLARAIAMADTTGNIRRATSDRSRMVNQAGGMFEDRLEGIQLGGLSQLANAQGRQLAREAAEDAQDTANRNQMIGTVASVAAMLSSRAAKDTVGPVKVLPKLAKLQIDRWMYKGDDEEHIGTYAEDFNDAFGTNRDRRGLINIIDAIGVTMKGVQELNEKLEARKNAE